jgi:hypothetical protein
MDEGSSASARVQAQWISLKSEADLHCAAPDFLGQRFARIIERLDALHSLPVDETTLLKWLQVG